jgi:hypothetical protein
MGEKRNRFRKWLGGKAARGAEGCRVSGGRRRGTPGHHGALAARKARSRNKARTYRYS